MSITAMNARRRHASQKNGVNENDFGMTLISSNKKLPVESLKFNRQYQRATETARKEKVKQSIIRCGQFLTDQSLTVNQDYEVVDGQHRLLAAKELGISHIPATVYHFSDKQKEAAFFVHINGFVQALNPVDYWYGRNLSGCPVAQFMYLLEEDTSASKLANKIVVKGSDTNSKITPTQTLEIILHCTGRRRGSWNKKDDETNVAAFLKIGRSEMLRRVNDFVSWVEEIFGTKKENPAAYRRDSMRAICLIHNRLSDLGIVRNKTAMNKLKSFHMGTTFITAPMHGKKYQIIDHFNKGRKKNRIPYNLEKE